jgi:tRNA(Ile)-lysidine synthase
MLDRLTIERIGAEAPAGPIFTALSGGGDSTALLHLMCEHFGAERLGAVIVDHALRAGSDADARRALESARALGVPAQILTLSWPAGAKRSQQAARQARYQALCGAARDAGARVIALGHTADDQAETVLMRAAAGSAWRGLAGIAPVAPAPVWPEGRGLLLARPLLAQRREDLRAFLRARGAAWIEDPANVNLGFKRVRVRERLAALEAAGLAPMRLAGLADCLRIRASQLDAMARALIDDAVRFDDDRIAIDRGLWRGECTVRRRALSVLLAAAAGAPRGPDARAVERLEARFAQPGFHGGTLGGAAIVALERSFLLTRDPGALSGRAGGAAPLAPLPLTPNREAVWDGRLALAPKEAGWAVLVEEDRPVLARGDERRPVATAQARWLLADRAAHLLGQVH